MIGVVVFFVLLIIAMTTWLKRRKTPSPANTPKAHESMLGDKPKLPFDGNESGYRALVEAPSGQQHAHELRAPRQPIEVPGDAPLAEL